MCGDEPVQTTYFSLSRAAATVQSGQDWASSRTCDTDVLFDFGVAFASEEALELPGGLSLDVLPPVTTPMSIASTRHATDLTMARGRYSSHHEYRTIWTT